MYRIHSKKIFVLFDILKTYFFYRKPQRSHLSTEKLEHILKGVSFYRGPRKVLNIVIHEIGLLLCVEDFHKSSLCGRNRKGLLFKEVSRSSLYRRFSLYLLYMGGFQYPINNILSKEPLNLFLLPLLIHLLSSEGFKIYFFGRPSN